MTRGRHFRLPNDVDDALVARAAELERDLTWVVVQALRVALNVVDNPGAAIGQANGASTAGSGAAGRGAVEVAVEAPG